MCYDPAMLCKCGCGQETKINKRTRGANRKGEPQEYVRGHWSTLNLEPPNPSGICKCGCGLPTIRARVTVTRTGAVRGEFVSYRKGHAGGHTTRRVEITDDLWTVTDCGHDTPCWVWNGTRKSQWGHCSVWMGGKEYSAHRTVYELHREKIPDGLELDHLCRNPPCVNPDHLEPVTHAVNIRRSPLAKLTQEQVDEIRESDEHARKLAERFGVTTSTIYSILARTSWK